MLNPAKQYTDRDAFYRATLYASAVFAVVVCPPVLPSVRPSQAGIVSKRLDKSSWFWREGFLPPIPHGVIKKFGYLQKLGYFPLEFCSKLKT